MRALRPAPSPSPYQSPTPSPAVALRDGVITSPPSPSAVASPGQAPAPEPEPSAVRAFTGGRRGEGSLSPPLIAMLAVVGAALLVVLYARLVRRAFRAASRRWRGWRRRRRRLLMLPGGSPANDSFSSFTTYDNYYHTFSPYDLDDAAIKSLPSAQFLRAEAVRVSGAGTRECAVCLLEFADGDELRALPLCAHAFHADCIDVWLRAHASCPLCRAAVALPPPVASPLRSARRVRPSLDGLLFFHPVPLPPPDPTTLPEIRPASPGQLNPRDFLLKRSYSFGFERNIAMEPASTASSPWRYRLGVGCTADGARGRGRSFWSKRWPSPFGSVGGGGLRRGRLPRLLVPVLPLRRRQVLPLLPPPRRSTNRQLLYVPLLRAPVHPRRGEAEQPRVEPAPVRRPRGAPLAGPSQPVTDQDPIVPPRLR